MGPASVLQTLNASFVSMLVIIWRIQISIRHICSKNPNHGNLFCQENYPNLGLQTNLV